MRNVALDEQRHIGFGVKLLRDLAQRGPRGPRRRRRHAARGAPRTRSRCFVPPHWDRSYTECFGFTLEEIYEEGARSFEAKMRAAGLPLGSLPGPQLIPGRPAGPRPRPARHRDAPGRLPRREDRPAAARPGDDGDAVRLDAPRGRPPHRARRPVHASSGSSPTPSRGTCASTTARPRRGGTRAARRPRGPLPLRGLGRHRRGPARPGAALATGRLRPRGTPRALWRARGIF